MVARRLGITGDWSRRALDAAQLTALVHTVRHALDGSRFYREHLAGLEPESLGNGVELSQLPFLTATDIIHSGPELQCVSQSQVARVVSLQTSGSTGPPKRLLFTAADLAATLDFFAIGMQNLVTSHDRVLVMLPFVPPDSVDNLLIRALAGQGIAARGLWPPQPLTPEFIRSNRPTCAVGLPQHLLALAEAVGPGQFRTMLLSSDYAPPAIRARIEESCGATTFLHYGTTESGLAGAVECSRHDGCHIRESDLLIEIIEPHSGELLPDGALGEVVLTTLGREAMPLIRYRTGDLARLTHSPCACTGITARLWDIRGRMRGCRIGTKELYSQDLDDVLWQIRGLLDYRATVDRQTTDRLNITYLAAPGTDRLDRQITTSVARIPAVQEMLATGSLVLGDVGHSESFTASHTGKRSIVDQRDKGDADARSS
ncbi:MAG: DVU_1553 family AMP-dependent CoA ligase [Desulfopila sp.]